MKDPVDDLKFFGGVEPVRYEPSHDRCLLESKHQAVITDDAP
jgi:hypothetical protein